MSESVACRKFSPPEFLAGELRFEEPMSRHTSWRTGGVADYMYFPRNKQDLVQLLEALPETMPVAWIGLGSNLLVRDGGIRGMVIQVSSGLRKIAVLDDCRLYAESGASSANVAKTAASNRLKGAEFLASVPGSFGGALAMNAGAFGDETWHRVESIECVDRRGKCTIHEKQAVPHGYRRVELPRDCCILAATLVLEMAPDEYDGREIIRDQRKRRNASQPVQTANAGSVFRNPEGDYAARLIEQCGLKGHAIGNAAVSDVHANFIVNRDRKATSRQIEQLIFHVRDTVEQNTGVLLVPEVRIVGDSQ
ncbi:MAG: UDP-N-acetylmuramate dehydrogenase [Gammaproteobacteria bacterium]|nr:UDP-N-acetylmuramate dehydrogenase [Gammaproteobacteria bacterium]